MFHTAYVLYVRHSYLAGSMYMNHCRRWMSTALPPFSNIKHFLQHSSLPAAVTYRCRSWGECDTQHTGCLCGFLEFLPFEKVGEKSIIFGIWWDFFEFAA